MINYYSILELGDDANGEDIKRAYRRLAKKYHPDVSDDPNAELRFIAVNEAYEFLRDDERRRAYSARRLSEAELLRRAMIYEQWVRAQQELAQRRARGHARTTFDEFSESAIYKTAKVVTHGFGYLMLVIGLVMVTVPVFEVLTREVVEGEPAAPAWHAIMPVILGLGFIFGIYFFVIKAKSDD